MKIVDIGWAILAISCLVILIMLVVFLDMPIGSSILFVFMLASIAVVLVNVLFLLFLLLADVGKRLSHIYIVINESYFKHVHPRSASGGPNKMFRAVHIIKLLFGSRLFLTDLSQETNMSKLTVANLLLDMRAAGLPLRDEEGRLWLEGSSYMVADPLLLPAFYRYQLRDYTGRLWLDRDETLAWLTTPLPSFDPRLLEWSKQHKRSRRRNASREAYTAGTRDAIDSAREVSEADDNLKDGR